MFQNVCDLRKKKNSNIWYQSNNHGMAVLTRLDEPSAAAPAWNKNADHQDEFYV